VSSLEALLLGLVQGLTEFLPVSSSGHLVMLEALVGAVTEGVAFEVAVHAATMLAVLIAYRRRVAALAVGLVRGQPDAARYVAKLAVAMLPVVALVLLAGDAVEALFEIPPLAGAGLLLTGAVVMTTRRTARHAHADEPGFGAAFLIGCAQALALVPGISRSGATVSAALALRVSPPAAAEFSFLLSAIAIAGAAARELMKPGAVALELLPALAIGSAASLVSGIFAIAIFVRLLRTEHFYRFAYYAWAVGALFLSWHALRGA
jgi:undecaprenyl-diphosphatase